jgi:outer membrane receptor protein involved in Fe transport
VAGSNLIAFYDKNGIGVRLAYNWRDDFLGGTGQTNVGAGPPSYTADYEQWDLSASWWINDNMQLFADVLNLTDETIHVYGRSELQTLYAVQQGARYNVGFRYKFGE